MDYVDRSRLIHFLLQFIPNTHEPEILDYFGDLVVRVRGQKCLVVTLDGTVGIRATDTDMQAEMEAICGHRHWVSQGRVYDRWYLLPVDMPLNRPPITHWIAASAAGAEALANWQMQSRFHSG